MSGNEQGIVAGFYERSNGNAFLVVTPIKNQSLPDILGYRIINGNDSPFADGTKQYGGVTMDDVIKGIPFNTEKDPNCFPLSERVIKQTPASPHHVGNGKDEAIYLMRKDDMKHFADFLDFYQDLSDFVDEHYPD